MAWLRQGLWQKHLPLLPLGLGGIAAVVLMLLSIQNVAQASSLQFALDREYALCRARAFLAETLATRQASLWPALSALTRTGLGFVYLAVRDSQGALLASAGRYENLDLPLLTGNQALNLRKALYRFSGSYGEVPLPLPGEPTGALEYSISNTFVDQVHDRAVQRLQLSGWLGLGVGLTLLAGFILALRSRLRQSTSSSWLERIEAVAAPDTSRPGSANEALVWSGRVAGALDAGNIATLTVDRNACVRHLNAAAERLTGWNLAAAQGQKVYSVCHVLGTDGAPQLSAAEQCLRLGNDIAPAACLLRARDGMVCPVEMFASLLRSGSGSENGTGTVEGAVMLFQDRSAQQAEVLEHRRQTRLSQGVIDHLDEGILTTDPAGVVRFANARILRMFGYTRAELESVTVTKLMPVPFLNTPGIRLTDYIVVRGAAKLPKVVGWRKDATTFPIELLVQPMSLEGDDGLVVVVRDITERLRGDNLASRLGRLLDSAAEEIFIFDAQTLYFLEVNRGARRNLGYRADQLSRMTPLDISSGLDAATLDSYLGRLRGGETGNLSYRTSHRRADGSEYPVEVRLNFSRDEEPPVFMAIATDISSAPGG
jgi:PAS domain S-box-containing protein